MQMNFLYYLDLVYVFMSTSKAHAIFMKPRSIQYCSDKMRDKVFKYAGKVTKLYDIDIPYYKGWCSFLLQSLYSLIY